MQDKKNRAKELYISGFGSLAKVAKSLDVSKSTVDSWKNRDKKNGDDWVKLHAIKKDDICNQDEKIKNVAKVKKKKIKELEDKLTEKQRLFAYYYIQSFNATQSAIKAGYSKNSAMEIGSENLRKPMIKKLILELRVGFNEELHLDANRILNRHANIAMSDIKDFVDYGIKEFTYVDFEEDSEGKEIPVTKTGERFEMNFKDSKLTDGTLVKKVKMGKFGLEFELEDRGKSLEFLTRYLGLDDNEIDITDPIYMAQQLKKLPKEKLEVVMNEFSKDD